MADEQLPAPTPYGAWPSPLAAADLTQSVVGLHEPRSHGGNLYWLESLPTQQGRCTLMCSTEGASPRELTPAPYNVRTRVHEYGGGAYLPTDRGVFFVNFADQQIYCANDNSVSALTQAAESLRFADLALDAQRERLIAVVEDHAAGDEPANALYAIALATGALSPLHQGHDFYAAPRLSPAGERLAFLHWDHPNMPWDGSQLCTADIDGKGRLHHETIVAGGAQESVVQPEWVGDGLLFLSDRNGFWNLYRFDASGCYCVLEDAADFASPSWVFGMRHFAALDDRYLVALRHGEEPQLLLIDSEAGFGSPLPAPAASAGFSDVVIHQGQPHCLAHFQDRLPALVRIPLDGSPCSQLRSAGEAPLPTAYVAAAEHVAFPTRDGATVYAFVYMPRNPRSRAPSQERPPLLVITHGGPTAATSGALNLRAQYYTSRGWAVADVNYRGSSGYGRAYRDALRGQWGVVDVQDCEDVVKQLIAQDRVDPQRVAIRGGSAGGYTTLAALTTAHTFKAGASHYGIGDLAALAADTHKFESRYLDGLLGNPDNLHARSPIQHIDALSCPVIFFQGGEDKVVPPNQSQAMVGALRAKGIPVAYLEFAEEGHGFRASDNIVRAIEAEYEFFCRVFEIDNPTATDLEIDNL